jgi:phospholipase/carboxylesterase
MLFVPTSYNPSTPAPLALLLHGAGRDASELMTPVSTYAQSRGLVLLSLSAVAGTWDAIYGDFGPDVKNINTALAWLFERCNVDPARIGVMGFSDGATYAIAMARINGDLFKRATIYSPGYLITVNSAGKPEFFVTHGTSDQILSVNTTRNVIVPSLRTAGYSVEYHEWDGGHGVTAALLEQSVTWFVR